ncbi:MAG: hypothetical protein FWF96_02925 [Kiritimatiellaeota bacterium]|nr:hypothetical protein [Kiritimatiellota bacterium]
MSDAQSNSQPGAQSDSKPDVQTYFEGDGFPSPTTTNHDPAGADTPAAPQPAPRQFSLKISTAKNGAPLGKAQKIFNRLVAQIENLRRDIARQRLRLDAALQYHVQKLHPLRRQIAARRGQIVIFAHTHLKTSRTSFSKNQRRNLRAFITSQLGVIISIEGDLPDEKLQAIFTDIEGMTPDEARRRDLEAERDNIEQNMADYGVDIDLAAFENAKSPEEFARLAADAMAKFKKAGLAEEDMPPLFREFFGAASPAADFDPAANPDASATAKPRKKSKKQLAAEAREKAIGEARARSLSSIYKQLARVFHPDLEQDPALKKQKETLMQQLTAAYRANDMHTLLRLEYEWLLHGERDAGRLSEEKLAIYNEVLREQVGALQEERHTLSSEPRYEALRPYATGLLGSLQNFDPEKEERELKKTLNDLNCVVDTSATGVAAIKMLKALLRDLSRATQDYAREQAMDKMMADAMDEMMFFNRDGRAPSPW